MTEKTASEKIEEEEIVIDVDEPELTKDNYWKQKDYQVY